MTANRRYTEKRSLVPERLRLIGEGSGHFSGDDGYALVMTALMLIPLTIITAFAVDLGAWYAQAARTQRAADAASLAGVVWLPKENLAKTASDASLSRNWFQGQTPPTCGGGATCTTVNSVQWKVTVSNAAPRYFSRIMALGTMAITRSATAAFNPQIPLGSPQSSFGNDLPPGCTDPSIPRPSAGACAGASTSIPNIWATINGPYEHHANGDPFSTRCWGNGVDLDSCTNPASGSDLQTNPSPPGGHNELNGYYKPDGYIYAVDVKTAGIVDVEIYDAPYIARQNNQTETGDNCGICGTDGRNGPITEFTLYDVGPSAYQTDTSPGNTMKSKSMCTGSDVGGGPSSGTLVAYPAGRDASEGGGQPANAYKNKWTTLCQFTAPAPGIYPLRVRVDDIPGVCTFTNIWTPNACTGAGQNSFAIRARGSATSRVYALDNMDIYSNFNGITTNYYLADIQQVHANKTVVIDLYDVGDVSGNATLQILQPPTRTGASQGPYNCNWTRSANQGGPSNGMAATNVAGCSIVAATSGSSNFNNQWLRIVIKILPGYTCDPANCWWKLNYAAVNPHDHTTWALNVIGDPVHLVE